MSRSNNNGVKTTGEPVIAGVKVTLTGTSDLGAIASTSVVTNSSGLYAFSNLRPGTYALTETQPPGFTAGKEEIGTPGGTVGVGQFTNIVLAAGVAGANNNFGETTQPPTVATAASASPSPATGTTCNLSVLGADPAGESTLTYTWATTGTPPAAVAFSLNGSNAAKNTQATFSKAGNYAFQVTITDAGGLTATSSVNVTVNQTLTAIAVAPTSINLHAGAVQQYTATAEDQFGAALATQPSFTWTTSAGTISASGLLTAPDTSVASGTVTAGSGGINGSATFTVAVQPPTVATAASASPNPATGTTCNLSVLGADPAGESTLTYTWAATGTPPGGSRVSASTAATRRRTPPPPSARLATMPSKSRSPTPAA